MGRVSIFDLNHRVSHATPFRAPNLSGLYRLADFRAFAFDSNLVQVGLLASANYNPCPVLLPTQRLHYT